MNMKFKFRSKPISRNNKLFFRTMDMDLTLSMSKLYLHFDNLFNGDKFLCDQTNALLNRRSDDILRELKRKIEVSFSNEIMNHVNVAFFDFPYSDYFLPDQPIPQSKVSPEIYEEEETSIDKSDWVCPPLWMK